MDCAITDAGGVDVGVVVDVPPPGRYAGGGISVWEGDPARLGPIMDALVMAEARHDVSAETLAGQPAAPEEVAGRYAAAVI